jgi:hypothetical protein
MTTTRHPRHPAQDEAGQAARDLRAQDHADRPDDEARAEAHDRLVAALVRVGALAPADLAAPPTTEPDEDGGVWVLLFPSQRYLSVTADGRIWAHEPHDDEDEPRATWGV